MSMHHAPCPFIHPNGSCSLPLCFDGIADASDTSLFVDMQHENGVFRVKIPSHRRVLYVPPVVQLLDDDDVPALHCHVVASWWWSGQCTLFIQVYITKLSVQCAHTRPTTMWRIVDFPLTCVDDGCSYHIHVVKGPMAKTKRKTE